MTKANEHLLEEIRKIKSSHPAWGYRRVWAYLRFRKDYKINKKRVYRLMRIHGLTVPKNRKLIATRSSTTSKPRTYQPNTIWGMDMTKVRTSKGWRYLHIVLDWGSKKIVGWNLCQTSKTADWLDALHMGLNKQFPNGVRNNPYQLMLVTDNGCQPTSQKFDFECRKLMIDHIFTSYSNPKGNADTERVIRTVKEDLIWLSDWQDEIQLRTALEKWVKDYNEDFPHMALGYMTPYAYEQWFNAASVA